MSEITEEMVFALHGVLQGKLGIKFTHETARSAITAALQAAEAQPVAEWEAFADASYFDMWCVRRVGETAFGNGFHVPSKQEADALVAALAPTPSHSLEEARRLALEEAAQVADDHAKTWGLGLGGPAVVIAAAIRALSIAREGA